MNNKIIIEEEVSNISEELRLGTETASDVCK